MILAAIAVLVAIVTLIFCSVLINTNIYQGYFNGLLVILGVCFVAIFTLLFFLGQQQRQNIANQERTEKELTTAKHTAENANKAKNNFLATMSHEIRTPIHSVIGHASLLAETELDEEQKRYAKNIYQSSMALLAVINDIIDFTYIETGKITLENSAFVLRDCLNEAISASGATYSDSKFHCLIDDDLPNLVDCDPVRLRQVLMSILGEAQKSEHIDVKVAVTLLDTQNDNLNIEFRIEKTDGKVEYGVIDSLLTKVAENGVEKNLFDVSALRLSIAARLVSLMGGHLRMINETNKGNIITFTVKAKKVDSEASEKYFSQRRHIQWLDSELAGKVPLNILAVDDHEVNQVLLVQILTKMGYNCKTARNGAEAVGMAVEEKFDIIFMDILMPVMDGVEATKRIREYYVNTDSPLIIGVTANALLQEKERGFEAGMNDFVLKPYKPIDIQNLIEKWTALVFKLKKEL